MGRRRWIVGAAVSALVVNMTSAGAAERTQVAELPPPTLSSTDLHVGDVVTITGTGCIDPDTGSGEGLVATAHRTVQGRGPTPVNLQNLPVLPDGSYAGTWTITQPLPPGPSDVEVWCTDPESGGDGDIGTARTTATGTPPALPGLTGEAGAVVPITYPCSGDGAGVSVRIRTLFTQMPYLEPIDGHLGTVGETMHIELPADLAPG